MTEKNKNKKFVVPVKKLRYIYDEKDFICKDSSEIESVKDFIGQEKAIEALKFGLEMENSGYNIFVTGFSGTGKSSVIYEYISKIAEERKNRGEVKLRDFCFVYNFENTNQPICLIFDAGGGQKFKDFVDNLLIKLKNIESDKEYIKGCNKITHYYDVLFKKLLIPVQTIIKNENFTLLQSEAAPLSKLKPGQPMALEEFNALSEEEKTKIKEIKKQLDQIIRKTDIKSQLLEKSEREKIENFENTFLNKIFDDVCNDKEYKNNEKAINYFKGLCNYVIKEIKIFAKQKECQGVNIGLLAASPQKNPVDMFLPFNVNIVVNNSKNNKPPVIIERHPTFSSIFGKVDKKVIDGVYTTDHTFIKAGSLCQADGGYWVVDINDLLKNASVAGWFKLEKTLQDGFLKIEDVAEYFGFGYSALSPFEIPINVKVIVIGDPNIYRILIQVDDKFPSVFQVKVEFDFEMPLNANNIQNYIGFISLMAEKNKLLPFNESGIARVIEYGLRLSDNQKKLSTRFGKIKNIIIEATYWAKKTGSEKVTSNHVIQAIKAKKMRINLVQEKMFEFFKDGIYLIDVDGLKVGQINGLVVYCLGDYEFGLPSRITAKTFFGGGHIISIQKESQMAGPIHNTGLLTLSGYFYNKYGLNKRLSFAASITFEQNYGKIEGDSASMAELVCLISSLADVSINQGIAMTGSVNQNGESQSIGGVNEKIEGFYNICKEKGLTGKQGVIIPKTNLSHLMLDEEVVDAVKNGEFCIYAIESVDDVVEILMDNPADEIYGLVDKKLELLANVGKKKNENNENKEAEKEKENIK